MSTVKVKDGDRGEPMQTRDPVKVKIAVGDKVGYRKHFLRSIGAGVTDPMWRARGTVESLAPLGTSTVLAKIAWNMPDLPERINAQNLARVGSGAHACNI